MNFALLLTWIRIGAIPIIVVIYFLPFELAHPVACVCYAIACITDGLDGYFARNWAQSTKLGAFLDPVADKLLVTCSLFLVLSQHYSTWLLFPVAVIVCREITISSLREWMAEMGNRTSVAVSFMGKVKTLLQMLAIGVLLFVYPGSSVWFLRVGVLMLCISALITIWSMYIYLKIALPDLTLSANK